MVWKSRSTTFVQGVKYRNSNLQKNSHEQFHKKTIQNLFILQIGTNSWLMHFYVLTCSPQAGCTYHNIIIYIYAEHDIVRISILDASLSFISDSYYSSFCHIIALIYRNNVLIAGALLVSRYKIIYSHINNNNINNI